MNAATREQPVRLGERATVTWSTLDPGEPPDWAQEIVAETARLDRELAAYDRTVRKTARVVRAAIRCGRALATWTPGEESPSGFWVTLNLELVDATRRTVPIALVRIHRRELIWYRRHGRPALPVEVVPGGHELYRQLKRIFSSKFGWRSIPSSAA